MTSPSLADIPSARAKKLVVCCDGTWQNGDNGFQKGTVIPWSPYGSLQVPTNVSRICRAIKSFDDREGEYKNWPQVVYYHAGIGSTGSLADYLLGGGIASGIGEYIREAYAFLVNNYAKGDEIILIGFSRGAFIVRSVAGLIGDMGLLTKRGMPHFYDVFHDWEYSGYSGYKSYLAHREPENFCFQRQYGQAFDFEAYRNELQRLKWNHDHIVEIKAIGVWDTVGALGIPVQPWLQKLNLPAFIHKYRFFDTKLSSHIQNAFQALGLDEHRAAFTPSVWEKPPGCPTNLVQTWFPGVHSNIGGSYSDTGIADLTLAWMMSRLSPWLAFDDTYIPRQRQQNAKFDAIVHQMHKRFKESHCKSLGARGTANGDPDSSDPATAPAVLWASNTVYNSSSDLVTGVLGGSATRAPGQYHQLDPLNDRPKTTALQNTNERMHASVRERMANGGLDEKGHFLLYQPVSMKGWKLLPGIGKEARMWVYEGPATEFQGKVLIEDEIGVFEKDLMSAA